MFSIEVGGINAALYHSCKEIMSNGDVVTVRDQETTELHPAIMILTNPTNRTLIYPGRGNNPFSTLFETIWLLGSKDNDITYLSKFLPRAKDYSDNPDDIKPKWRAGYPERLRAYRANPTVEPINQLRYVYDKLSSDPQTRQAVAIFWNPYLDDYEKPGVLKKSRDYSCSQLLNFLIRDGKLDLTFYIRSNDAIFGMTSINIYEFTAIQEIMAKCLNVKIGKLYYMANSLHLYAKHYDKAWELINNYEKACGDEWERMAPKNFSLYPFKQRESYSIVEGMYHKIYSRIINAIPCADGGLTTWNLDDSPMFPADHRFENVADIDTMISACVYYYYYQRAKDFGDYQGFTPREIADKMLDRIIRGREQSDLTFSMCFWMLKDLKVIEPCDLTSARAIYQDLSDKPRR